MAATLSQMEDILSSWPATPKDLSTAAAAIDEGVVWGRIERYVGARWTMRPVVWLVEGPGDWWLPLEPAEVTFTERWTGTEWESTSSHSAPTAIACLVKALGASRRSPAAGPSGDRSGSLQTPG